MLEIPERQSMEQAASNTRKLPLCLMVMEESEMWEKTGENTCSFTQIIY
jgi:hypothetical protein